MARYYSPSQGRFTSPDLPFADQHVGDPQSWNLYAYGKNNPLRYVDRTGHENCDILALWCWYNEFWATYNTIASGKYELVPDPAQVLLEQKLNPKIDPTAKNEQARKQVTAAISNLQTIPAKGLGAAAQTTFAAATVALPAGSVWKLASLQRGIAIEELVWATEYSSAGWWHVGAELRGKFPLVDFQKGNTLVSLKSVDTAGSSWLKTMQAHINDLFAAGATIDGAPAKLMLDLRVPSGGKAAAESLVGYGAQRNVTVVIKELP